MVGLGLYGLLIHLVLQLQLLVALKSKPTVSKQYQNCYFLYLYHLVTNLASRYLEHSFNLNLFGSDKTIFLFPLIFDNINPHNKPMAPPPCTRVHILKGFLKILLQLILRVVILL